MFDRARHVVLLFFPFLLLRPLSFRHGPVKRDVKTAGVAVAGRPGLWWRPCGRSGFSSSRFWPRC
ncbi:hypothetical protein RC1_3928 [Rhodospirillum centenum SW]|uniref:Uncharacterized protein n=1 Tax=Rhodospirillum centenum (strain ATCC 51521 / SW) TaxID=414684 RepID=B6IY96_RHOCS|nr:hypothetical protein RC1_3928 [Rhodospirillum centenum SW]